MTVSEGNERSFGEQGSEYQVKLVQALLEDHDFADMMIDVLKPEYFTLSHLKAIVEKLFEYKLEYREFPSLEVVMMRIQKDPEHEDDSSLMTMLSQFIDRIRTVPLNGDGAWIKESSLEFCKRGCLIEAVGKMLDKIEGKKYEDLAGVLREALNRGAPRDHGHEYSEGFDLRSVASVRKPVSTGWPVVDKYLNGGWERKTLSTFIAPTGAGKSMFLVNAACAAVEQGLNVFYATLEMADFKIGLRADSYYSGVSINDVPLNKDKVQSAIASKAKGRLIIKEWPTKRASVETLRGHLQRLKQAKDFVPDMVIVDYADLLRSSRSYGEKRHELEGVYEELRGVAQEFNCIVITADQTNRGGLDLELVTLSAIAESYAKATVCDLIITVSRTPEDKVNGTGRIFIAKSRLGEDGKVLPILFQPSTVKVTVLDQQTDPLLARMQMGGQEATIEALGKKAREMMAARKKKDGGGEGN